MFFSFFKFHDTSVVRDELLENEYAEVLLGLIKLRLRAYRPGHGLALKQSGRSHESEFVCMLMIICNEVGSRHPVEAQMLQEEIQCPLIPVLTPELIRQLSPDDLVPVPSVP